ncbi:MAG: FecR domain-containing protein [Chryseolinea sp.]
MHDSLNPIEPELLVRFLSGETNHEEQNQVKQWIEADHQNKKYFEELSAIWKASAAAADFDAAFLKNDWKKIHERINTKVARSRKQGLQRSLFYNLARVAAVLMISFGLYLLTQKIYKPFPTKELVAESSAGKKIFTLPDGTTVFLNANSKLTYTEKFNDRQRAVTLEGEAFFEVTPNPQKPFHIKTGAVTTEVVGTSFNINTKTKNIVVTVVTGKVLFYKNKADAITMTVGEQGIYSDKGLEKTANSDLNFLSWKTNILIFKNTSLTKVVEDLNRHYGSHVQIASRVLESCTLTSTFQHQTLEQILQELEVVFAIELERDGAIIMLQGKGC